MQAIKFKQLTLMAAICLALPAVSLAQDAKPQPAAAAPSSGGQVAKVNGVAIPQSRMDLIVKDRTAQGQPDSAETRTAIKENLITMEAIAQEATRMGLDKSPEVATRLELARQQILAPLISTTTASRTPSAMKR